MNKTLLRSAASLTHLAGVFAIALALVGLLFPAPIFAQPGVKPIANETETIRVDAEALAGHLKDLPTVFTMDMPSRDSSMVFLKGADGFFYSDANDESLSGFVSLKEAADVGGAEFTYDEEAGTFSGRLGATSPDKNSTFEFNGYVDSVTGTVNVSVADKSSGGFHEFSIAIPDLGLADLGDKIGPIIIVVAIPIVTLAALLLVGCAGILATCYGLCVLTCPNGVESVVSAFCGAGTCTCKCTPPELPTVPECV